jgi:hypothetical protein
MEPAMPEIKESTLRLLQQYAIPLEDTVDTVIERMVAFYAQHNGNGANGRRLRTDALPTTDATPTGVREFDPSSLPDVTHTKLMKGVIGTAQLPNPKWNDLLRRAHEIAFDKVGRDFDRLRSVTTANLHKGSKSADGYAPLGNLGFSIQGVAANDALRIVLGIAKKLALPLEVVFDWRLKEGALHPGETGRIIWKPWAGGLVS